MNSITANEEGVTVQQSCVTHQPVLHVQQAANNGSYVSSSSSVPTLSIVMSAFFLTQSILIISFNGFAIVVIATTKHLQTRINRIMLSLLAADLSVGLAIPLHVTFLLHPALNAHRNLCLVRTACNYVSCLASVLSLLLVTTDRYMAIVHPFRYSRHGALPHMSLFVAGAWLYALAFGATVIGWNRWPAPCNPDSIMHSGQFVPFCACLVYASCMAMTLMYAKVFSVAAGQERRMFAAECSNHGDSNKNSNGDSSEPWLRCHRSSFTSARHRESAASVNIHQGVTAYQMRRERKYAKVTAMVVAAFTVCWLPVVIILTLLNTGLVTNTPTMFYIRTSATVLFVSNSLINSVIYIWNMPDFHRHCRSLCSRHRRRSPPRLYYCHSSRMTVAATATYI